MKKIRAAVLFAAIVSLTSYLASCGSAGEINIEGPTLSTAEATALVLDQFYSSGGTKDEYEGVGEFSVYLRDASTGLDIACVHPDDMKKASKAGVFYGALFAPLQEVEGEKPGESARFKLVFVEQDGRGCPRPIDDEDVKIGESPELMFEGLMNNLVWATNGAAAAYLRPYAAESRSVRSMAPSLLESLIIDKLYFTDGGDQGVPSQYYVFIDEFFNGSSVYQCQLKDEDMADVRYGGIVYAALNIPIQCFSGSEANFADRIIRIGLYRQADNGPALIGEIGPTPVGELIGESHDFTNGAGFMSFRSIVADKFEADALRLEELITLKVSALKYSDEPTQGSNLELFVADADSGYIIACSGEDQGFVGIGEPSEYLDLDANLTAIEGQRELFGWRGVNVLLAERTDGKRCPRLPDESVLEIGKTLELLPAELIEGKNDFESGDGYISLTPFN